MTALDDPTTIVDILQAEPAREWAELSSNWFEPQQPPAPSRRVRRYKPTPDGWWVRAAEPLPVVVGTAVDAATPLAASTIADLGVDIAEREFPFVYPPTALGVSDVAA